MLYPLPSMFFCSVSGWKKLPLEVGSNPLLSEKFAISLEHNLKSN
jgi:hypothetical protein